MSTCGVDKLLKPAPGGILQVTPPQLDDSAAAGSIAARITSLQISNGAAGVLGWTAAVSRASPWLQLGTLSGNAPGTLGMSADPTGLGVGVYHDTIVVAAMSGGGEARIPVQFTVHPCVIDSLVIDSELFGSLGSVDCVAPHRDSTFADLYRFVGSAGDSVSIELVAGNFTPYLVLDTTATPPAAAGVPLLERSGCAGLPGTSCLRYQRLSRSGTFVIEAASLAPHDSGSYTLRVFRPRAPHEPESLEQLGADSVTAVATGGVSAEPAVVLRGVVRDPDAGDSVRLEVEMRPVGEPFTGAAIDAGALVAADGEALVRVTGLTDNTRYHWHARTLDQTGRVSAWSSYGANAEADPDFLVALPDAPAAAAGLGQFKSDAVTAIAVGAPTDETIVVFKGTVFDQDPGETVRLEVEVRPLGVAFTDEPTASSAPVTSGSTTTIAIPGLPDNTHYHWQARALDQTGRTGPWTAFGENLETTHDFYVRVPPSRLVFTVQPTSVVSNVAIAPAVTVSAQDVNGAILTSFTGQVTIALGPGSAGAVLSGTTAAAAVAGVARFSDLRIDRSGSGYTLVATSPGLAPVASSSFVVTAGLAAKLVLTTPPGTTAQIGVPLSPQPIVRIQDAAGNNVSQGGRVIAAAIASGDGTLGGTLTANTNSSGVASFTDLKITGAVGTRTLRFTSPGLTDVTSSAINLTAGPASTMDVNAGNEQSAAAGTAVAVAPSVIVRDASGNPVTGVAVTFVAPPPVTSNGSVTGGSQTTNTAGIAQVGGWTLGTIVGTDSLQATSPVPSGSPLYFTATVIPGPATAIAKFSGDNLTGQVNTALQTPHVVLVADAHGNPVPGVSVTWAAAQGGGSVQPAEAITDANGLASTVRTLGPGAGTQTTSATSALAGGSSTVTFVVNAKVGGAAQMTIVAGDAQTDTVGQTLPAALTVLVTDAFNNPVADVPISWTVIDGGGTVNPPTATTNASGVATTNWTLGTATTPADSIQQVQATGVASPLTFIAFTVPESVSGAQTTVAATPGSITASTGSSASTLTVTVRDQYGNVIKGKPVTLTVTGSGNTMTPPAGPTDANGVATGMVSSTTAETKTVSARVNTELMPQTAAVTVTPAPASSTLSSVAATSPIASGTGTSTITVTGRDEFGNLIPGATVALTATGTGNTLIQPSEPTNANGVATGTLSSTVAETKTVAAAIDAVAIAETAAVTVTAGTATKLIITSEPAASAQSSVALATQPVVRLRDALDNDVSQAGVVVRATMATGPAGLTMTNATATTSASGVATFSGLALSGPVGAYRLRMGTGALLPDTSTTITLSAGPVAKLAIATEPPADAPNATVFTPQPAVQLQDLAGNAVSVSGIAVTASLASGGGTLGGTLTVLTDGNGLAAFTNLTITGTVGPRTLAFSAGALTGATSGTINVAAGAPSTVALNAGNGQTALAGTAVAIAPSVIVRDVSGNPVSGVSITFAAAPGSGSVTPVTPVLTNGSGVAAATAWTLGTTAGTQTLTATTTPDLSGSPMSFTATALVGAATTMAKFSGDNLSGEVGTTLATPHDVLVSDIHGNPVAGVTVNWAALGGGSVNPVMSVTDAAGHATTSRTLGLTFGTQTTTATATLSGGSTTVTFNVNATVGGATQMDIVNGNNQVDTVSQTLPTALAVRVADRFGNPVAGVLISWTVLDGGGSVSPASSTTDTVGIATTSWTLGTATTPSDSIQLVRATGVASARTFTAFTVPGPVSAEKTTVTAAPGTITASSGSSTTTITVTVRDQFSNAIKGKTVTLTASGAANTLTQPATPTDANGVTTGALSSTKAETKTVSALADAVPINQTANVTVSPAPLSASLSTIAATSPITASNGSSASTITVAALDEFSNPIPGALVLLAASGTGNTLTQPASPTNSSGVTTGSLSSTVAESKTVGATISGVAISQTASVTVNPGGVSLALSTVIATSPITAGTETSTITVTARDAQGNPVPGVIVSLAVTGTGNTLTGPAAPTDANGVATGTLSSTVAETKTVSARLNGQLVTQTATVVVAPAAVSATLSTVAATSPISAGTETSTITVTARDEFSNPISGAAVVLAASGGGNTLTQPAGVTNTSGVASGTLGSSLAEAKTVSATINSVAITQTATVVVNSSAAAKLVITTGPPTTAQSGVTLVIQPAVRLRDAQDNDVSQSGVVVTATVATGPGGATLTNATATTDANGVASFTDLTLSGPTGTYTLSFGAGGLTSALSGALSLAAGPAAKLAITTQPSATAQNAIVFPQQPVVQLQDEAGNPVNLGGSDVTAAIATGGGTMGGALTVFTDAGGVAAFPDLAITGTVGQRTLRFTASGLTGVTSTTITLTAGAPTTVALNAGNGQTATAGTAVAVPPSVLVRDVSSNPVSDVSVTFAATSGSGTATPVAPVLTDASGVAAATSWTLGPAVGEQTLAATTSPALTGSPVTFTATATAGAPTTMVKSSGDGLTGQVFTTLATPHEVRITDANGNPVAGVAVTWIAATGGGSVSPAQSSTNADGRATATRTLGIIPGTQTTTATATLTGGSTTVTFTVTATVGGATQMTIDAGQDQVDTVGHTLPVPLAVRVADDFNNPVAGVLISWAVLDGAGLVNPSSSTTNASGIATTSWTLGTATTPTDSIQLVVATGVASPITFTAFTVPDDVNAEQTSVTAVPTTIAASTGSSASTITVTARDQFGNVIKGKTVVLAATGTGNSLTQPPDPTDANGVATGMLSATQAETKLVSATVGTVAITQLATVVVQPATAQSLAFLVQPSNVVAATNIAPAVQVEILDAFANRVTSATNGIGLTIANDAGGGTLTGGGPVTANAGVAAFIGLSIDRSGVGYTLQASSGALATATSTPFTVSAGSVSASQSSVTAAPNVITASAGASAATVTVTARDASGNPIEGATVILSATGNGNAISQPALTNASGVATGSFSSTLAQVKTVSAIISGVTVTQTATVTVEPASPNASQTVVAVAPGTITASSGSSFTTISVTVRDAFANPVPGATVSLAASGSGNTLTQPAVLTGASGVTTGTLSAVTSGIRTVSATVNSTIAVTQTVPVTVLAAPAAELVFTVQPTNTVGGVSIAPPVQVTARDPFGNTATSFGDPIAMSLATNPAGGELAGTTTVPATSGVATFANLSIAKAGAGYALGAASGGLAPTTSNTFDIAVGAVSAVQSTVMAAPDTVIASSGASVSTITVTARDAVGNPVVGATVLLAATGTATTLSQPGLTDENGVATGTLSSTSAQAKTVSATVNGVAITKTDTVTVIPAAPAAGTSTVTASPTSITASTGSSLSTITVTVRDEFGNRVSGATVALSATGTSNTLTQPVTTTNTTGVTTGSLSSTTAESKSVSATVNAGLTITQTATVTVTPSTLTQLAFIVNPTNTIAGALISPAVQVAGQDQFGNTTTSGSRPTITVSIANNPSGGTLSGTRTVQTPGGGGTPRVSTFSNLSINKAGVGYTLQATAFGLVSALSAPFDIAAGAPASIVLSDGNNQSAQVGTAVALAPSVLLRDANANVVPGASVTFAVASGGGSVTGGSQTTNALGVATVESWTLGATAGTNTLTATAAGSGITGNPVTFTATGTAGPVSAAQSTVVAAPTSITAGTTSTITVTARDANGNPVAGATVVLAATGTGNTLTQPAGTTNASGVATGTLSSTVTGSKTVSATINTVAITQTAALTVIAGAASAAQSSLVAAPTSITAGTGTSTITVTARDQFGNPIPGATVVLAATGSGNTATQPELTDASGIATGTLSSTVAEAKTVSATISSVAITQTATVTVTAAAVNAAQSTVAAAPSSITAGTGTSTITVTARDANGNPVAGATVVLAATGTGNTLTQPTGTTNASGVATGSLSSTGAGSQTVSATINSIAITQTATVTVIAAAVNAAQSTVTAAPTSITAVTGSSTITVTAKDQFGNPIAGATVVLAATGTGNTLTQPAGPTNASGVATGSLSSIVAESKTVSATINTVAITQTAAVAVTAGPVNAAQSSVVAAPTSIIAGTGTSTITVTARDANGNPVSGATVVLAATGTGNTLTQPTGTTNASGVTTGTLSSTVAQGKTVSATINSIAITQTAAVTVTAGAVNAAQSTVAAAPLSIIAGVETSTITVTARDVHGNPIQGATVVLTATGGGNTLTQPVGTTNVSGVATGSLSSTAAGSKTVSATINSVAIAQTVTVTVTAGAVSAGQSTIAAAPSSILAGTSISAITVTAKDANGNPVAGATVILAATGGGNTLTQPVGPTNASGVATGSLSSTVAESKTVSATIDAVAITPTATVTVIAGAVSAAQSTVIATPAAIIAGSETSAITVTARDAHGNPIQGATVVLAATGSGNTLSQPLVTTNANAVATGSLSSTSAGNKTVSATINAVPITQTATVTVTAGAVSAAQSTMTAAPTSITAGTGTSTITVTARDANGNPIQGATVVLTATGSSNTLTQPVGTTNASGVATGTLSSTVAEGKTVSATINTVAITQTATVTVSAATVSAGQSTVTAAPTSTTAGAGTSTITVTAKDAFGNPISGATVVLAATGTGNTLTQPASTTNGSGVATGTLSSTVAEGKTVSATINAVPITQTATVTVTAGTVSAGQSTVTAAPTSITAGPGSSTITVTAKDQFGNPIAGAAVVLAATGAGNTVTQPVGTTNASGVATGSLSSTAAGSKTVSATINTLAITQTATVTVTAGAVNAAQSTVAAAPTSITAGTATSTITVTAKDQFGNPIAGATVVLGATGAGNTLTQPVGPTNGSGLATGTLSSTAAENKTVSASINSTPVTQTATVTVTAGAVNAAQSTVAAAPTSITTGTGASTITVTAKDQFGNPIAGATVVLAATGTGNTLTQPTGNTSASGVATGTLSSNTAENKTVSATINSVPIAQTAIVTVTAGAVNAAQSTVTAAPTSITAGTGTSTITVTAKDQFGNPIVGATVTLTASGSGNTVIQPGPTNAGGVATGTLSSTVAEGKTVSATINTVPITQTAAVMVTPAALSAAATTVSAAPGTITASTGANTSTITVTARDQFNNPIQGATVVLTSTGTSNTLTQPAGTTGINGVATGTISSTVAQSKTVSATVNAIAITQTATVTVTAAAATTIAVNAGSGQTATVNTDVTTPPSVLVTDAFGNPVTGVAVSFAVTAGGGTVSPGAPSINTNASGVAALNRWTLGTVAGTNNNVITATSTGLTGSPLTFTATATAGAATQIAIQAGNGQSAAVNTEVTTDPAVLVRDQFNNPVANVNVTFTVTGGGGTILPASPATIATNTSGVATLTSWTLGATAGTNTMTVASTGLTGSPLTFTATGTAGAVSATTSTVSATPGSIAASSGATTSTITVTARDQFNNAIQGATVVLAATGSANTITQPTVTNASGVATGTLSSTVAEAKTVSATISSVPITQMAAVTVTAGTLSASLSTVTAAPASITAGTGTSTITVTAKDQFGNPIAGATVVLAVTGTGNTLTQPVGATNASGVVTGTLSSTVAASKTVSATISTVPITQTATVTVTAGAISASQSTVTAAPASITAGTGTSTITVTAKDQFGNPITGATVTLTASGGGNTLTQPVGTTNASGVATGTLSSTVAEGKTVSATINTQGIIQTASVTVNAGPVSAALSTVVAEPTTIAAVTATSTITVTAKDQFGNLIGGATVVLIATGTGNTLTQPGTTNASGVATGSLSSVIPETKTVSATINSVAITQTATVTVEVLP